MKGLAKRKLFGLLPVLLLTLSCAGLQVPDDARVGQARARLAELEKKNADMPAFKGIGKLRIRRDRQAWSVRMAWVGAAGGRLRVEALGLTGQPFAKLVCNAPDCHFLFQDDSGEYRKEKSDAKSLKPLTGIAVDVDALVQILGGGVPIADHDTVWLETGTDGGGGVLVLQDRWRGVVQKIRLAADGSAIRSMERFGFTGLRYRVVIRRPEMTDGRLMPHALRIEDGDGNMMAISVERCWVDIALPAGVFAPELPENPGAE